MLLVFPYAPASAPGPHMSMKSPSGSRFPAVVQYSLTTTAAPRKTQVVPEPALPWPPIAPGKSSPLPLAFARGSTTSTTRAIRHLSPGLARLISTRTSRLSWRSKCSSSSVLTESIPSETAVLGPKRTFVMLMTLSSSLILGEIITQRVGWTQHSKSTLCQVGACASCPC